MNSRCVRDINYVLLPGTNRGTTDIVIERDGLVAVRPPATYTPEQVDAVVESKRMWIYRNLAEWRELNSSAVSREWVNGESFLYLGRSYRLSIQANQDRALMLKDGRFCLSKQLFEAGGIEAAKRAFEGFYTDNGMRHLNSRVALYGPKVGVSVTNIRIKDLGYRWASCTKQGALTFNWKCFMAPLKIIDYIVVHELCHMHHQNHSVAFWNEVDKILPDYRENKTWLKFNGASLDL